MFLWIIILGIEVLPPVGLGAVVVPGLAEDVVAGLAEDVVPCVVPCTGGLAVVAAVDVVLVVVVAAGVAV